MPSSLLPPPPVVLLGLSLLLPVAVPAPEALAQDRGRDSGEVRVSDERLEAFVRAYVRIGEVRDELHTEFARQHAVRARAEARQAADRRIEAVLQELGVSADEFGELNRLIGVDPDLRARFDAFLEELRGGGG